MSRFVSGGTVDEPTERDDQWLKAQEEIEAKRRRKEEEGRQNDGKSLYEVLQANKAAKQEAFEESTRLANQFRSLDQDEVEFLDSVLESTRAKEDAVRKETAEQLEAFRRQQEDSEKVTREVEPGSNVTESDAWAVNARKRKRGRETLAGVKLRKSSSSAAAATAASGKSTPTAAAHDGNPPPSSPAPTPTNQPASSKSVQPPASVIDKAVSEKIDKAPQQQPAATSTSPTPTAALGLAAYSSDDDD